MPAIDDLKKLHEEMAGWRHELHANAETAYEEKFASDFAAAKLEAFGLKVHRGLAKTGVVGVLSSGEGGRSLGLRADMDALPMQEAEGLPYRSRNEGKMHACGHDGHVAMLLGAAKHLAATKNFNGTVYFIFQPAEESGGGGREMVKDGLFGKFPCDAVYGLHNWPALPLGQFGVRPGPLMASSDKFEIELAGHGCHAAAPHTGVDLVAAAAALVQALHTIVSRSVDPVEHAVVSVTQVHAGDAFNVIPDKAVLRGTARAFSAAVQDKIEARIREICAGVCSAFGARAEVRYIRNYPPTVNHEAQAAVCAAAAEKVVGRNNVVSPKPVMGAEDFSFLLAARPGCYVFAGSGPLKDGAALHNPRFDFNDELLPLGAAYWTALVEQELAR